MNYINGKYKGILSMSAAVLAAVAVAVSVGASQAKAWDCGWSSCWNYGSDWNYSRGYYYSPTSPYSVPSHGYVPTPVYSPVYYPVYSPVYNYPALTASCYPNGSSVQAGASVQWVASVSGGTGSYSYSWSGTDGLTGYGSSAYATYYNTGYKTASVAVTSGNQTANVSCGGGVNVYSQYYYSQPVYYPSNYYNYGYNYNYPTLTASCSAGAAYSQVGTAVTWTANAYGGSGSYNYSWSGTDSLGVYGNDNSSAVSYTYTAPGTKVAQVTVYSGGQTVTQTCSNTVSVGGAYAAFADQNAQVSSASSGLDIGCYADPSTAYVGQPVTWNAEASGGSSPYSYSWTGSDGLSGSQGSIIKYYGSTGDKSAIVSVTSADGKTGTRSCTNSVTVRSVSSGYVRPSPSQSPQPSPYASPSPSPSYDQGATSFLSLSNVPWGWIAVLVILVLFATVIYLLFNRPKI